MTVPWFVASRFDQTRSPTLSFRDCSPVIFCRRYRDPENAAVRLSDFSAQFEKPPLG